jgi:hypothetical protein
MQAGNSEDENVNDRRQRVRRRHTAVAAPFSADSYAIPELIPRPANLGGRR